MTTEQDESLANFWEGWPETARRYREQKQQQVLRLQTTNDALHTTIRARDTLLRDAEAAIRAFMLWWESDELDGNDELEALRRVKARIRAELNT